MTECERLIAEGTLPPEFLESETRECEVSTEMKKLWALQIDLLRQVDDICKRHNLMFFAICGTAIGAVRHNGFIPWDDDVDIALKRDEYNKFIEYAKVELDEPYFLQTPLTDKYFYSPHASLRNSNATCIARGDGALKCNNGAAIHIFPLDGYTDNKKYNRFIKIERIRNIVAFNNYHFIGRENYRFMRILLKILSPIILFGSRTNNFVRHENRCTIMSMENHKYLGIQTSIFLSRYKRLISKKENYDDVVLMPFEYYEIPVPIGFDDCLTHLYGDYMELPPIEQRNNKHTWEMDPDTPYKEYCSKKYGVKY